MANRQSVIRDATQLGRWLLRDVGRELRVARLTSGMTQAQVARMLGTDRSRVSRIEGGLVVTLGIVAVARHAAIVNLKPWLRLFPVASRPLDKPQLDLFARFRDRIASTWQVIIEAPMPIAGDLRAADALLITPGCRCMVEIITRLADFQAQVRAARLKQRDINADRLILVIGANTTNRRALQAAGSAGSSAFPIGTKAALRALAAGADPGGDCLILL
jgi:transcriptional regulator with XRE-family HTH domain